MFHDCWCSKSGSIKCTECRHKALWTHPNFHLQYYRCGRHKTMPLCNCWVKCLLSVCLSGLNELAQGKKRDKCSFPYLLRNASMKRLQIDKNAAMLSAGQLPGKSWPFFCWTWTSQMSVSLPQLSEAIMTICSALFLVSRSMFSHETLDPSNQSLLSRACGPCLNHNFMSSTATAVWRLKF